MNCRRYALGAGLMAALLLALFIFEQSAQGAPRDPAPSFAPTAAEPSPTPPPPGANGRSTITANLPAAPAACTGSSCTIFANTGWQQTLLTLQQGDRFTIQYTSGQWTIDFRPTGFPYVGPDGYSSIIDSQIASGCKVNTSLPYARLLGQIGNGSPFSVDVGGTFTANATGALALRINDQDACLGDNDGAILLTAQIEIIWSVITGRVTDANGNPIADVTMVTNEGSTTRTGTDGTYGFGDIPQGTFTVTPSKVAYTFSPSIRTVTVPPDANGVDFIAIPPAAPSANFDAWPQTGEAPLTVSMHIVSTNNIATCAWDYGDGTTGNSCAPYHDHIYRAVGSYTVKLTVSGSGGSDTMTRNNYINVTSPQVQFSTPTYTVGENSSAATILVMLNPASTKTVTVRFATSNGTATAGSDYTAQNSTLTLNPGETSKSFNVPILQDNLDENDETVNLTLSNPTNATLGAPANATLTIGDDDPLPTVQFSSANYSVNENGGSATIQVSLSPVSGRSVTVNYATSNGTAIAGSDYTAKSGTLTFNAGQTSQTFTVAITDDNLDEPDETVNLALSNPSSSATLGTPANVGLTIIDNEPTCYTLIMSVSPAGSGTVTNSPQPNCQGSRYLAGTAVSLSATPNAGYMFGQWSGSVSSAANPLSLTMDGDKSVIANFNLPSTFSISGRVADTNNQPISGVTLTDGTHTALTDANGNYTLQGVAAGSYTVTPSKSGYTFSPSSRSITVPPNATSVNFTGTPVPLCYTLTTSVSPSGAGSVAATPAPNCQGNKYTQGTTVSLLATVNTGYIFGQWSGSVNGNQNPLTVTMDGDKNITANFDLLPPSSISGRVLNTNNNPIPGVTIADGAGHTTTTDASGNYTLSDLVAGTYTLTPGKSSYTFAPTSRTITVPGNATGVDFVGTQLQLCGAMDVAFVVDTTTSMGEAINHVKTGLTQILASIEIASNNDYRLALVTFGDNITIRENFAPNNRASVEPKFQGLSVSGGGLEEPEASDEALNTVVNMLPATGRPQNVNFAPTFRAEALKVIILVTDARPGGFDDAFTPGVDDINAHTRATQASAQQIKISAVFVPTRFYPADHPTARTIMQDYAGTTNGVFIETTADGSGTSATINNIIARCGTTFSISGKATDAAGAGLLGVTITDGAGRTATTDVSGNYTLSGLVGNTYTLTPSKSNYAFSPATRAVTVPPNATEVNFVGTDQSAVKPPLLIVHGIQTLNFDGGYKCKASPERFNGSNSTLSNDLPRWFAEDGYDVWIAYLDSSPLHTPSLAKNAKCLRKQIDSLYSQTNQQKITLVAHSMGGLVSRACLSFKDCRNRVKSLYTLGSPHGGLNWKLVTKVILFTAEQYLKARKIPIPVGRGVCIWQTGLCDMSTERMLLFNHTHRNQRRILYTFIGGDATPKIPGWIIWATEGANDGAVGSRSAVGWSSRTRWFLPPNWPNRSMPYQYWTDEVHVSDFRGHAYYASRDGGQSQAYQCIKNQMGKIARPSFCRDPNSVQDATETAEIPNLSETTVSVEGVVLDSQTVTHTVNVDTNGAAAFVLAWTEGDIEFKLVRPDGQLIDPAYATANPSQVGYGVTPADPAFPPLATYVITSTSPGAWQLVVQGNSIGSQGAGYIGFVLMETNRTLSFGQDANLYNVGDTAMFTAALSGPNGGISGASVSALLKRPDGITETLRLADVGGGIYQANYLVPNAGGHVAMTIIAIGDDGNIAFNRQTEVIWTIVPQVAQFTGVVSDQPEDRNGDGRYDALLVDVQIAVTQAATYTLSAQVGKGDLMITNTSTDVELSVPGTYTVRLSFDGEDIGASRVDGPYTISNAILTDSDIGVPVATVDTLHTTAAYRANQFVTDSAGSTIYLPVIGRN